MKRCFEVLIVNSIFHDDCKAILSRLEIFCVFHEEFSGSQETVLVVHNF